MPAKASSEKGGLTLDMIDVVPVYSESEVPTPSARRNANKPAAPAAAADEPSHPLPPVDGEGAAGSDMGAPRAAFPSASAHPMHSTLASTELPDVPAAAVLGEDKHSDAALPPPHHHAHHHTHHHRHESRETRHFFEEEEENVNPDFYSAPVHPHEGPVLDAASAQSIGTADCREGKLDELFTSVMWRNMFFLWLLGLINNFHYNLVISAASGLATKYGMKRFVALISFCNVFLGIIARILNTFALSRISFNIRMTFMSCLTVVGLFLVAYSRQIGGNVDTAGFVVMLLGVTCVGTAYSYGETVALTYVQRYPAKMVGAWSAGTGISGVVASVIFIILSATGVDMMNIFLISSPLAVVYWLTFTVGLVAPQQVVRVIFCNSSNSNSNNSSHQNIHGGAGSSDGRTPAGASASLSSSSLPRRATKRVVLFRGREDEMLQALEEKYRDDRTAFVTEPTTEMVPNLFGISWKSVPVALSSVRPGQTLFSDSLTGTNASSSATHTPRNSGHAAAPSTAEMEGGDMAHVEEEHFLRNLERDIAAAMEERNRLAAAESKGWAWAKGAHTTASTTSMEREKAVAAAAAEVRHDKDGADDDGCHCPAFCSAFPVPPPLRRWWRCYHKELRMVHKTMGWFFLNLAAVYIAEYAVQFLAPFSFLCAPEWGVASGDPANNSPFRSSLFWLHFSYPLSQVCYQLGVFISRSSLMVCGIRVSAVGVLSILQIANAIGWLIQAKTLFISDKHSEQAQIGLTFLLFAWMIFVGLLGGTSYVNVFYLILSRSRQQQDDYNEVAMNTLMDHIQMRRNNRNNNNNGGGEGGQQQQALHPSDPFGAPPSVDGVPREEHECAQQQRRRSGADNNNNNTVFKDSAVVVSVSGAEDACDCGGNDGDHAGTKLSHVAGRQVVHAGGSSCSSNEEEEEEELAHHGGDASTTITVVVAQTSGGDGTGNNNNNNNNGALASLRSSESAFSTLSWSELTQEELHLVALFESAAAEKWQRRRELAMSTGSFYAMAGICFGTILDVLFTNTFLKHGENTQC